MLKQISLLPFLSLALLFIPIQSAKAQSSFLEKLEIGAAGNYSALHYESDGDVINEIINYDFGFQAHVLINHDVSKKFKLQWGLEYFFFTYQFEDVITMETNPNGGTTGNYFKTSMPENFNTSYLAVPIRIQYHPFSILPVYFTAGPEFSYKIGYSNSTDKTVLYSENDEPIQEFSGNEYNVPESANDFLISGIAGVGYNLNHILPVTIELKAKHSITPYFSGDNVINSWIRSFSLSVSYHL